MSRQEAIKELKRELNMRKRVYPRLIQRGKLNKEVAKRQYMRLFWALQYLAEDHKEITGEQGNLFE